MTRTQETPKSLHIFDADGTLLPGSIVERAFWELVDREVFELETETFQQLKSLQQDPSSWTYIEPLIQAYVAQKRGKKVKDIRRVAEELAEADEAAVFAEMRQEIAKRKLGKNATLAIISGSPEVFVKALAKRLGFDFAIGSHFQSTSGIYHPHRPGKSRDKEKHVYAQGMLRRLGDSAYLASAYGDTISDVSVLEIAAEPTAVNPTDKLRQLAVDRHWRVIDCVQ